MPPTQAQQFRAAERSKLKKKPATIKAARRSPNTDDGARNLSKHGERKATVATEENHSGKPSRKSTRPSSNHGKNSTTLEHLATMKAVSPQARHSQKNRHAPQR